MPVMVEGGYFGGLLSRPPVFHQEGWEIRYQVLGGSTETVVAETIPEAVELALPTSSSEEWPRLCKGRLWSSASSASGQNAGVR